MELKRLNILCEKCGKVGADQMTHVGILCRACRDQVPFVCDFCTKPSPEWYYETRIFGQVSVPRPDLHATLDVKSVGGWTACEDCSRLIEADRFDELVRKAIQAFSDGQEKPIRPGDRLYGALLKQLMGDYMNFMKHRTGKRKEFVGQQYEEKEKEEEKIDEK